MWLLFHGSFISKLEARLKDLNGLKFNIFGKKRFWVGLYFTSQHPGWHLLQMMWRLITWFQWWPLSLPSWIHSPIFSSLVLASSDDRCPLSIISLGGTKWWCVFLIPPFIVLFFIFYLELFCKRLSFTNQGYIVNSEEAAVYNHYTLGDG